MITEDYVSFETAKLLKEKGFDEKCLCSYRKKLINNKIVDEEELFVSAHLMLTNNELKDKAYRDIVYCSAPTLQMVMKWLREEHNIYLDIRITNHGMSNMVNIIKYYWVAISTEDAKWIAESTVRNVDCFKTYNEAIEDGIKYCLENLI